MWGHDLYSAFHNKIESCSSDYSCYFLASRILRYLKVSWKFWLHTTLLLWNAGQPEMAEQLLGSPSYVHELLYLRITLGSWNQRYKADSSEAAGTQLQSNGIWFNFEITICVLIYTTWLWRYSNDFQKNADNCKDGRNKSEDSAAF